MKSVSCALLVALAGLIAALPVHALDSLPAASRHGLNYSLLSGSDLGGTSSTPGGAADGSSVPLSAVAQQGGVLLDTFKRPGDIDDTAALARAVAADMPILLGPKTYRVRDFNTGNVSRFLLRGLPGVSRVQRTGGSGSAFVRIAAEVVSIDGVDFDMNSAAVSATQWGVILNRGGQTVSVRNSAFRNNSGSLGSCFALINPNGNGPAGGGSFTFENNEVTGCTTNAAYFASVANGVIRNNSFHDNPGAQGLYVSRWGTTSATNYSTTILIAGNRTWNNGTGIAVGGIAPPYDYGQTWSARGLQILGNYAWDNSISQITSQGERIDILNNVVGQIHAPSTIFGILCNGAYGHLAGNRMSLKTSGYGFDCGGGIGTSLIGNRVEVSSGSAFNIGGTRDTVLRDNVVEVDGTTGKLAMGVGIYATEGADGQAFPTTHSNTVISGNRFNLRGENSRGIILLDNAGGFPGAKPNIIRDNDFNFADGAIPTQGLTSYGSARSTFVEGNRVDGGRRAFVTPRSRTGPGEIVFNVLFDEVQTASGTVPIRSILSEHVDTYKGGGSILYVYPTAQGSGYSPATTVAVTCSGGGPTGVVTRPLLQSGVLVGVRLLRRGSGCVGTPSAIAVDSGGGTGAVLVAENMPALPAHKKLAVSLGGSPTVLQRDGGAVTINMSGAGLITGASSVLELDSGYTGRLWSLRSTPAPPVFTPRAATFTGSISGTRLTVSDQAGKLAAGMTVTGAGVSPFTTILSGSGPTWTVSLSQMVASTAMIATDLPTCNATTDGSEVHISGSATGKWHARCDGTRWLYPDGTAAP